MTQWVAGAAQTSVQRPGQGELWVRNFLLVNDQLQDWSLGRRHQGMAPAGREAGKGWVCRWLLILGWVWIFIHLFSGSFTRPSLFVPRSGVKKQSWWSESTRGGVSRLSGPPLASEGQAVSEGQAAPRAAPAEQLLLGWLLPGQGMKLLIGEG